MPDHESRIPDHSSQEPAEFERRGADTCAGSGKRLCLHGSDSPVLFQDPEEGYSGNLENMIDSINEDGDLRSCVRGVSEVFWVPFCAHR